VLASDSYILKTELADRYISKEQCEQRSSLGYDYTALLENLLDILDPWSETRLEALFRSGKCDDVISRPEVKVELLAYLNFGDQRFRKKAIVAFGHCARGFNDAFLLARTVRSKEPQANLFAYALSITTIIENSSMIIFVDGERVVEPVDPKDFNRVEKYLKNLNAPAELVELIEIYRKTPPDLRHLSQP